MSEKKVFTGSTPEEALAAAKEEFGCDNVLYEVNGTGEPCSITAWTEDLSEAYAQKAHEFLAETIKLMGIDAEVVLKSQTENTVDFEFLGEDIALLIGKHGKTIDALQYLADVTAYKKYPCRKRVSLDADNHRSKRTEELKEKVLRIAEMVRQYGKEAVMEPQSAKDRRFIHMLLADQPGVKTYSEGTGAERHIVISPK
ncbi:MAG: KH domain-containing protein [Abditibacteriota bacterium]|nr:KH domain-containing protein [Abditibacteriota bacterium]